jgi:hypothetical protein
MRNLMTLFRVNHDRSERGQALLIVALAIVGLAAFIGLMVDSGILFIANGHLRRAVDASALAAASQLREGATLTDLERSAREFMALNNVDPQTVVVDTCATDATICTNPPRKFIRIQATQRVQFAFLTIIGFSTIDIRAEAISEAASVDTVIAIDTSETMAKESDPSLGYGDPFDPSQCNANAAVYPNSQGDGSAGNPLKCRPLWDAKTAAKAFVQRLYDGYDQVAVISFDYKPIIHYDLSTDLGVYDQTTGEASTGVYRAIDLIPLHDDAAETLLTPPQKIHGGANPLNFDCNFNTPANCPGTPTESKAFLSSCSGCGMRVAANILKTRGRPSALWVIIFLSDGTVNISDLPVETYNDPSRVGHPILDPKINALNFPNGFCQGSIAGYTGGTDPGPTVVNPLWSQPFCVTGGFDVNGDGDTDDPVGTIRSEKNFTNPFIRHCGPYHPGGARTCPPGSMFVGSLGFTTTVTTTHYYDAQDYVRDMIDQAALAVNCKDRVPGGEQCTGTGTDRYNENEPVAGANLSIYSIGLGLAANPPEYAGEELLRYMAAVGDDGDRVSNPCVGEPHRVACGNYYYAPSGSALVVIFEDIAKRVFTRLTK